MKRRFARQSLSALAAAALLAVALLGCQSTGARPAALTGEEQDQSMQHERHATGIESQVKDF